LAKKYKFKVNNLLHEEEESHYQPDFSIDEIEDDSHYFEDLIEEEYDDDELDRRKSAYADLKKSDKIFNNSYNIGLDQADDEEVQAKSQNTEIKMSSTSPDYHLYDSERYSEHVDLSIVQRDIYSFIESNSEVKAILGDEPDRKKFTKPEVNSLFKLILVGLTKGSESNVFVNPIHVLDVISTNLNMEYKKLFDMLEYENKEVLLLELNTKYKFLDGTRKNAKIF
jgi:hypothetical protein